MHPMLLSRRALLRGTAASLAAATLARAQSRVNPTTVASGNFTGQPREGGVTEYLGIPYAQPPLNELRFRPPVPIAQAAASNLGRFAPSATQANRKGPTSEDCLYLNVYAPDPKAQGNGPFPVFVWIHGGGYTGGSPVDFDGTVFARQGIVVVTVAYRLGVFGFFDWAPLLGPTYADSANNGVRDIVLALHWVQANIRRFNGDPARVTVGGQSAGAKLTAALMAIDEAKPLFASAISESGGGERINDTATGQRVTAAFAAQLKDTSPAAILAAPAQSLLSSQLAMIEAWPGNFPLRAQKGGALLPHGIIDAIGAGSARGKRVLMGTNKDENALYLGEHAAEPITQKRIGNTTEAKFNAVLANYRKLYPDMSPADLNIRALTAEEYWVPSIRVGQAHARGGGGATYFYRLDEPAATGAHKGESYHSYDLGYVWETLPAAEPPAAHALETEMHNAWAAFIQGKAPAATGLPTWPQWNPQQRPTMILNSTSKVEQQPYEAELKLWDGFKFD